MGNVLILSSLAGAGDDVFVGGDFGERHGAASVELLGGDAYFGSETELPAVGEGGGNVGVDACGIDFAGEEADCFGVFGDDGFAVARAVLLDEVDGLVDVGNGFYGHFIVEPFVSEVGVGGVFQQGVFAV